MPGGESAGGGAGGQFGGISGGAVAANGLDGPGVAGGEGQGEGRDLIPQAPAVAAAQPTVLGTSDAPAAESLSETQRIERARNRASTSRTLVGDEGLLATKFLLGS